MQDAPTNHVRQELAQRAASLIVRGCFRVLLVGAAISLAACGTPQLPSYGNFGGPIRPQVQPQQPPTPEGELIGAEHQVRWYPRSARFSPDESHLLVSLCHFRFGHYCRVARYWIAESRWEVVPHDVGVSAVWPDYSPDGQRIVYAQQRCEVNYQCSDLGFKLATMTRDGQERRELGPVGVQMPTWSPDARRLLYWRLNGVGRLASGRTIGSFDVFEFSLEAGAGSTLEQRITRDAYLGIYTAPRYLPDGERFLYSAYTDDGSGNRAFVVGREEAMKLARMTPRRFIPVWDGRKRTVIYAFHALRGWLVASPSLPLGFVNVGTEPIERLLFDSTPYVVGTADVSPSGRQVLALTSTRMGTMEGGGATGYWTRSPSVSVQSRPVMSLIDVATATIHPVANWPADVERITQPRAGPSASLPATQ